MQELSVDESALYGRKFIDRVQSNMKNLCGETNKSK